MATSREVQERVTFCRICEAYCGLIATVDDGQLVKLRPDSDHPLSKGEACPKGIAMTDVQNDPDRVVRPLRRRADGEGFDEVTWDEAIAGIGTRLRAIIAERGPSAVGWYEGNTAHFSYSHFLWTKGFLDGLGTPHFYSALSQDANNLFASSAIVFGTSLNVPFPDLARTRYLLMLGANPLVSHGSAVSAPRVRSQLLDITRRGGRVIVVDPRRTETAELFEHVPIEPDTDVLLLAALLQVVFAEKLADTAFIEAHCQGADELEEHVRAFTPAAVAQRTRIPAATIRDIARELARGQAVVYGRSGTCLGRFATLTHCLLNALNAVTGNLDRPGGAVFGVAPLPIDLLGPATGLASFGSRRSPIGNFPDVVGTLPAATMAKAITTAGPDRVRALFVGGGNPVNSVPNSDELADALDDLDLMVSLDLYVTETNRHADYVLPATTFLERDDTAAMVSLAWFTTPFFQYTDAVLDARGDARQEWEIIDAISREIGIVPSSLAPVRWLGRLGIRLSPKLLLGIVVRIGPYGDWFGLRRSGLSLPALLREPHGRVLGEHVPTGHLRKKVRHKGRRVSLAAPVVVEELARLSATSGETDAEFPMRMIGLRELRSHNSWMHNVPKLMAGNRAHGLRMHPDDATALGLTSGQDAVVTSRTGAITLPVRVTDEMISGTVAVPHGWGHRGGWTTAIAAGGDISNRLTASAVDELEPIIGHAILNGVPVRVTAAG